LRKLERVWLALVFLIPGLAVFAPQYAQAYGNLFFPALLLVIGLGLKLRSMWSWRPAQSIPHRAGLRTLHAQNLPASDVGM
jgi:hypothetical protein